MHDLYNILRLYDGIEKPLVVLKEKNKNLIDMQSNCMAEVPKRYVNTCNCNVLIDHIYLDALIYIYIYMPKTCQGRSRCFATEICGRYKSRLRDESLSCPCKVMASNLDKYMHDYLNAYGLLYNQNLHLYMCQGLGRSLKQRKRKLKKQRTVWRNRRQKRTRSERTK